MTATPRRVLLVDDDEDLRSTLALLLAEEGWEVREARDGAEAIEQLRSWQPSVMLLDWRMPVMDGGQVLARLKELPRAPSVVLSTASAEVEQIAARHQLRFRVGKPFGMDDLLGVLEEACAAP